MQFSATLRSVLAAFGILMLAPPALAQQNLTDATRTVQAALQTVFVEGKD